MADLAHVLRHLPVSADPSLLLGRDIGDDAAVYRLSDDLALVQTVDFFTPIVDDPYTYGQIAAANSLSDVYAVGARPLTAMNLVGFPFELLPESVLAEILRGGADKAAEAGVTIVGGHTVDDLEPKYGLSVTGTVHPSRVVTGHGARPGDVLVLTKPLGTGTIATALKGEAAAAAHVDQAVRWMTGLNRAAAEAMLVAGAHAATDITGYGLLGHLSQLCTASAVAAEISFGAVPLLPGAHRYVEGGFVPKGTRTNLAAVEGLVDLPVGDEVVPHLLADPQTSGGLLIALPPKNVAQFGTTLGAAALSQQIGRIVEGQAGHITITA